MGAALAAVLTLCCTDSTTGHPSPYRCPGLTSQWVMGFASCSNLHVIPLAGNCNIPCYSGNGLCVGSWGIHHCTSCWACMVSTNVACPAPPSHSTEACTHPRAAAHCSSWGAAWWGSLGSTSRSLILHLDLGHHATKEETVPALNHWVQWGQEQEVGEWMQEVKEVWTRHETPHGNAVSQIRKEMQFAAPRQCLGWLQTSKNLALKQYTASYTFSIRHGEAIGLSRPVPPFTAWAIHGYSKVPSDAMGLYSRQWWKKLDNVGIAASEFKVAPTVLHFATQRYAASRGKAVCTLAAQTPPQKMQSCVGWGRTSPVQQSIGLGSG